MKNKFSIADRTTQVNGITTIRPVQNGKPGPTLAELNKAISDFEVQRDEYWRNTLSPGEYQKRLNQIARDMERSHIRYVEQNL